MSMFVGIDPGKKGGLVALNGAGYPVIILPFAEGLRWLLALEFEGFVPMHAYVEKAQAMPGQGVSSMFNYGVGFGEILGVLRAKMIPHTLVPPQVWSRVMHAGTKAGETKARSLEAATRLFPSETWMLGKQRKPQDGLYEAALIAEYGRRQLVGKKETA